MVPVITETENHCAFNMYISLDDALKDYYRVIKQIGKGSFGTVVKARDNKTGDYVAIKFYNQDFLDHDEKIATGIPKSVLREVTFLKTLVHDNIVALKRVLLPNELKTELPCISLVFDYYAMTLSDYIHREWVDQRALPNQVVKKMFNQILSAVTFAHSHSIVHRDLKPSNIMITQDLQIKVGDFGLARYLGQPPQRCFTTEVGTMYYVAPEMFFGSTVYNASVDVWSLGCILAEMLTKVVIFHDPTSPSPIFAIFDVMGNPKSEEWEEVKTLPHFHKYSFGKPREKMLFIRYPQLQSSPFKTLLESTLVYNPDKRLSCSQLWSICEHLQV
jgi:serine/threonine protein kinase